MLPDRGLASEGSIGNYYDKMKNVEIRKTKKLEGGTLKIDIAFKIPDLGTVVIKGFRVTKSQYDDGPWVQEPSYRHSSGQYCRCFFMENPKKWEELKNLLQKKYENHIGGSKNGNHRNKVDNESVDATEIPF